MADGSLVVFLRSSPAEDKANAELIHDITESFRSVLETPLLFLES